MDTLDDLVESAAIAGETATRPARWLIARGGRSAIIVLAHQAAHRPAGRPHRIAHQGTGIKAAPWTSADDAFLRENLGWLSEQDIAAALGRTAAAVRLRWKRELHLEPPSKQTGWLSAQRVAHVLCVDVHAVRQWQLRGILDGWHPLPVGPNQGIYPRYRIRRSRLWSWAVNPRHWIYFHTERVRDPRLRRILALARRRWGDDWWTTGQVAAYHGVHHTDVNRCIYLGRLPAVRWQNWRVLRSDATDPRLVFYKGPGSGHDSPWSEPGDAFLVLARAVGLSYSAIGRLVGWPDQRAAHRLFSLRDSGRIPALVDLYGLPVRCRPATGDTLADWSHCRHRFPAVARAMDLFAAGRHLTWCQRAIVAGVLAAWTRWYVDPTVPAQLALADRLSTCRSRSEANLRAAYDELRGWGVDPLANDSITGGVP